VEASTFWPLRRPERDDQSYEPLGASINAPQNPNPWAGRRHNNQTPTPVLDRWAGGLPPTSIDIVREEIAGAFRDKLGVSMISGDSHIENPMTTDLISTRTTREQGYPNLQNFRMSKVKARMGTKASS
jgi:hypothetical protein